MDMVVEINGGAIYFNIMSCHAESIWSIPYGECMQKPNLTHTADCLLISLTRVSAAEHIAGSSALYVFPWEHAIVLIYVVTHQRAESHGLKSPKAHTAIHNPGPQCPIHTTPGRCGSQRALGTS